MAALRREQVATGGGPKRENDVRELENHIVSFVGKACVEGISGGIDSTDTADSAEGLMEGTSGEFLP